jgi:hypothetical protein
MTYAELLAIAHRCKKKTLRTVTGREFRVGVYLDCPFFIPSSTGQGRSDGRTATERFLERFNETGSLTPRDYQGLTRNASYLVILVQQR